MKASKNFLIFILLIGLSMSTQSCSKNAEPRFFVNVERDFDVNNTLSGIVTHFFELKNIPTKIDQSLALNNLAKENITGISPSDAILTNATGLMDWSLVSAVEVYAISKQNPKNKMQIFFTNQRDLNSENGLKLFNTFADLSEIMLEESIDLEVRLTTLVSVPGNFRARLFFNYAVFDEI